MEWEVVLYIVGGWSSFSANWSYVLMFSAFDVLTCLIIVFGLNTYSVRIDLDWTEHNFHADGYNFCVAYTKCKPRYVMIWDIYSWLDLSRWTERLSRGLLTSKIGSSVRSAKLRKLQNFRKQPFGNGLPERCLSWISVYTTWSGRKLNFIHITLIWLTHRHEITLSVIRKLESFW